MSSSGNTTKEKQNSSIPEEEEEDGDAIRRDLEPIYDEMRTRNRNAIKTAKAMREDGFFREDRSRDDDERRCLAISAIIDDSVQAEWSPELLKLQETLQDLFPEDLHFGQRVEPNKVDGQLHWTVMQLVGFADFEQECSSTVNEEKSSLYSQQEYLDCIQDSLACGGLDTHLEITYVGLIAVPTGLLMIGIPSIDTNDVRERLRTRLQDRGLPLKEPFVNNIVHSTLFRVLSNKPKLYERLLEIAQEYEDVYLGKVTLQKFQIGPASWRMLHSEVNATPPWRSWQMADTTASQAYLDRLEQDQERGVVTVSGATGAKLAKEIKGVLERTPKSNLPQGS